MPLPRDSPVAVGDGSECREQCEIGLHRIGIAVHADLPVTEHAGRVGRRNNRRENAQNLIERAERHVFPEADRFYGIGVRIF